MRKTLTLISVLVAAGSLAACKPFWEKEQTPTATVATTDPAATTPPAVDPTVTAETAKPAEQTAYMGGDKPAAPPTGTPTVPAKK